MAILSATLDDPRQPMSDFSWFDLLYPRQSKGLSRHKPDKYRWKVYNLHLYTKTQWALRNRVNEALAGNYDDARKYEPDDPDTPLTIDPIANPGWDGWARFG